jgi:beta-phosphoglucomutase
LRLEFFMRLRGVVFDFDGVIADSESLHFNGYRDILAHEGVTLTQADYLARYLGYDDVGAFEAIAADRGLYWSSAGIARLVEQKARRLEILARDHSPLFPGAAAAIKRLAAACPLAIASGALRTEISRVLEREGLTPYFVTVVGAEDVAASKPAPEPYLKAIRVLAAGDAPVAAEYVAIEDSRWGLESARAAGLRTIAVTHTYSEAELEADLTVANLDILSPRILEKLVNNVAN